MIMYDSKNDSQLTSDYVLSESVFTETDATRRPSMISMQPAVQSNGLLMARDLTISLISFII